jgi:tetratricopeptide (TPR) repeat protein
VGRFSLILILFLLLGVVVPANAQGGEGVDSLPVAARMDGFRHEYQGWNNCGPATLTMALSYFGWQDDQSTAARWLKPDPEDKNVSVWQMAEFVNTFTGVRAFVRYGGDLTVLKRLVAHDFPVVIAAGYEPDGYDWMGHYLLVMGYDDANGTILTQDSFLGPDTAYAQAEIDFYWRHFNRVYLVLHTVEQEDSVMALLGSDADPVANAAHALEVARQEAVTNNADPFAWFNMGTSYMLLDMPEQAAIAFDQSRNAGGGLPWRMLWYQFEIFEAYLQMGRYDDVVALAQYNLDTTPNGEHPVEETYYYAGLAREALGDHQRAVLNWQEAVRINPNFAPARDILAAGGIADGG